jgi:hypothetical protein
VLAFGIPWPNFTLAGEIFVVPPENVSAQLVTGTDVMPSRNELLLIEVAVAEARTYRQVFVTESCSASVSR